MAWFATRLCVHVLSMHAYFQGFGSFLAMRMLCMYTHSHGLACSSPMCACAVHMRLPSGLGLCCAYLRMRCLVYFDGLARSLPMCVCSVHAYLLSWFGLRLTYLCMCYAHILTFRAWLASCLHMHVQCLCAFMAWLAPCLRMYLLCTYTYFHGLARTLPKYACAVHVYFLGLACPVPMCACAMLVYLLAWLSLPCNTRRMLNATRRTPSLGFGFAQPCCDFFRQLSMSIYLHSWLGSPLACVYICYASILTPLAWLAPRQCVRMLCMTTRFMAWLVPRLCVHMLRMFTYSHGFACTSPMFAYAMPVCHARGLAPALSV